MSLSAAVVRELVAAGLAPRHGMTYAPSVASKNAMRLQNLYSRRKSAPESGAIFVSAFRYRDANPALAGGRGYKARERSNNSACPWTGSEPPAASGAVRSSVGLVQATPRSLRMAKPCYPAPTLSRRHFLARTASAMAAIAMARSGLNASGMNAPEALIAKLQWCGVSLSLPKTRPDLDLFTFTEDRDGCMSRAHASGVVARIQNNRAAVAAFLRQGV